MIMVSLQNISELTADDIAKDVGRTFPNVPRLALPLVSNTLQGSAVFHVP